MRSNKTKNRIVPFLLMFMSSLFLCFMPVALASNLSLRIGPPGDGSGGPNPYGIPPGTQDLEFTYLTDTGFETSLSVFPGLLFGYRTTPKPDYYAAFGGGLILSRNGVGPGIYAGFGADFWCGYVCLNAEYKQALAVTSGGIVAPYALRVGVAFYW